MTGAVAATFHSELHLYFSAVAAPATNQVIKTLEQTRVATHLEAKSVLNCVHLKNKKLSQICPG